MAILAKALAARYTPDPSACENLTEHQQLAKGHGVLPLNLLPQGQLPPDQLPTHLINFP